MKEALLAYEKIMIHQIVKNSQEKESKRKADVISDQDKKHLF